MLSLPKLSSVLFEQLHNSTWRLHDEATQVEKVKTLAHKILNLQRGDRDPNESIDTFKSRWLSFHENSRTDRKTRSFRVYNLAPGELLGEIKWSSHFRSYSFFPAAGCCFSLIDLADIQEFIDLLMSERVKGREKMKFERDRDELK